MVKSKEEFLHGIFSVGAAGVSGSNSLEDLRTTIDNNSGLRIEEKGHRVVDLDNVILPNIFKEKDYFYSDQELIEACIVTNVLSDNHTFEEDVLNEKIELLNDQLEFTGRGFKDDSNSTRLKAFELLEYVDALVAIDTENEVFLGWIPETKNCLIANIVFTDDEDDETDSK